MADRYGIKLRSARKFHYRGVEYLRGKDYAVPRDLRDHLVGSGYFEDTLVEKSDPKPLKISEPEPVKAPSPSAEDSQTGFRRRRGRPRKSESTDTESASEATPDTE